MKTPLGVISAAEIPDEEYPGIALLFKGTSGEPGAIMEYNPNQENVMLRVYNRENPDDEPCEILPMGWRDKEVKE